MENKYFICIDCNNKFILPYNVYQVDRCFTCFKFWDYLSWQTIEPIDIEEAWKWFKSQGPTQ